MSLNNTVLRDKFNEAMDAMKKDGTLKKISEQFFAGQDVTEPKDFKTEKIDISDVD